MKKTETETRDEKKWITLTRYVAFGVLFLVGLVLYAVFPHNAYLSSVPGQWLIRSFFFVSILVLLLFRQKQLFFPIVLYALSFAFVISYLILLVPMKIYCMACLLFAVVGGIAGVLVFLIRKKEKVQSYFSWIEFPAFISLLPCCSFAWKLGFVSTMPFWIPSVVVAVLALVVTIIYSYRKIQKKVEEEKQKKKMPVWVRSVGWGTCGFILAWIIVWGGLVTVNACFDFSDGEPVTCLVTGKDIVDTTRSPRVYQLEFEAKEGFCEIGVPKETYDHLEIGDSIEVVYFEGLLGEGYYIYPEYLV